MKPYPNTLNIFIDGSKMVNGVGIYCAELGIRQPFKLPEDCSIFQAEVFAVGKAAEIAFAKTSSNSKINIYVDSQAAINEISYEISSKNVLRSRKAIERLAARRRLHIYWVAGHKGIAANEIVDEIAKSAVYRQFEQENDILKPLNTVYNDIAADMKIRIDRRWNNQATCKTAKSSVHRMQINTSYSYFFCVEKKAELL